LDAALRIPSSTARMDLSKPLITNNIRAFMFCHVWSARNSGLFCQAMRRWSRVDPGPLCGAAFPVELAPTCITWSGPAANKRYNTSQTVSWTITGWEPAGSTPGSGLPARPRAGTQFHPTPAVNRTAAQVTLSTAGLGFPVAEQVAWHSNPMAARAA